MTKKYDFAVYIGRFQPFHNGHLAVIDHGLEIAEEVIVLVGSSNRARTTRNPFTFRERYAMIGAPFLDDMTRLIIKSLADVSYDDNSWVQQVQHIVGSVTAGHVTPSICLIGAKKDNSTYYLDMFPQWKFEGIDADMRDATSIRGNYFEPGATLDDDTYNAIPETTFKFLNGFRGDPAFASLMEDHKLITEYQAQWGKGPYVASDACVILGGHVAMVERTRGPGKGLLALPGGFLEHDESMLQGAVRELKEETGISMSQTMVSSTLKAEETFDDPHRSQRARIITRAFLFDLTGWATSLPELRCLDPEEDTRPRWVPLSDLRVDKLYDDHAFIIKSLLAKGA